jgi:hypothetical protein
MNRHLTEEQLILHYYGEAADGPACREHLEVCPECRREFEQLQALLAAVTEEPVPERGEAYGAAVWSAIAPRLAAERKASWWKIWAAPKKLALAGGMTALLLAAFLAGRHFPAPVPHETPLVAVDPQRVSRQVLLVMLPEHLERTQMVLMEIVNAPEREDLDISGPQELAADLLDTNRLYRQTASFSGDAAAESLLEDIEMILLEISRGPSMLDDAGLADLRRRIEAQGILFKVRVFAPEEEAI